MIKFADYRQTDINQWKKQGQLPIFRITGALDRILNYLTEMTVRPILIYPNPVLRKEAKQINRISKDTRRLAQDMLDTMYDARGIGLAAPQIGVSRQMFTMDCGIEGVHARVFINPIIVDSSEEIEISQEGCLSFPEQFIDIERPISCSVRYKDLEGKTIKESFEGLEARCVQHEIDHLKGKLFIDHVTDLRRKMVLHDLKKLLAERNM